MEPHVLHFQALVFKWVGIGWLGLGIYLDIEPFTLMWRATLGAFVAMVVTGILLRLGVANISNYIAEQEQQRREAEAAEQEAQLQQGGATT